MFKRLLCPLGILSLAFCEAQNYTTSMADAAKLKQHTPELSKPILRTSQDPSHKLDSMVTTNSYKEIYQYDISSNHVLTYNFNYDTLGNKWVNSQMIEYSFDSISGMQSSKYYQWQTKSQSFVPNYLHEVKYGDPDQILKNISYNYDSTQKEWIGDSKFEREYDSQGRLTKETKAFQWDTIGHKWIDHDYSYYEYTEDSASHTKTQIETMVSPPDTNWYLKAKSVDYYDESKILFQTLSYFSDSSNADFWENSEKKEYFYDTLNGLKWIKASRWLAIDYKPIYTQKFCYNKLGRTQCFESNFTMNEDASGWNEGFAVETPHDNNGNLLERILKYWNSSTQEFENYSNSVYYYDFEVPRSNVLEWVGLGTLPHSHKLDSVSFFNWANNAWVKQGQPTRYYYSPTTVVTDLDHNEYSRPLDVVFPNPAKGTIKIQSGNEEIFYLYNTQGSMVLKTQIGAHNEIDVTHLQSGLYIYSLGTKRGTLVIEP